MRPSKTMILRGAALLGLVGVEIFLARSMTSAPSIRGYVETHAYGVASAQKGLVRKVDVTLGEHVIAGQVIAELDPGPLETEIASLSVERRRLIAAARAGNRDDEALHDIDRKLDVLAERRDATHLKAPAEGTIESLNARAGDAVSTDAPVATIVTSDTRRVVACVPEQRVHEVSVGSSATVTATVGQAKLTGVVESLTPAIAELPPRCQPVVAKPPLYGRLAIIALDSGLPSLPGETELVAFGPPSKHKAAPDTQVVAPVVEPLAIDVPPALSSISRVEASGIVWVPSLERYIVVSDETGPRDRHAPWLFAMSRHGVLDPDPVVVSQLTELDDIESIASDDNDGLWLLASQSLSKNGKRPPARELLAHLVPEGSGYRADKQLRLAPLLANIPGIDLQTLDIEGLAFRNGALYIGVKTPTDSGRAVIYKVATPERLMAGDVAGANITLWGRVALPVQIDNLPGIGGIADMTFLTDTTLVIAATASAPGTKQQDGALYVVTASTTAGGDLHAAPLHSFKDLRPEGVTVSPSGQLAIVFDAGRHVPLWTELDLPHID